MNLATMNVTKSNHLIRASYKLTLSEQRVLICCLAKIDSRKRMQDQHSLEMQTEGLTVTALEYAEIFGLDPSTAYRELQQAADRLYNRTITVKKNERGERTRTRWLQGDARAEKGSGHIRLSFTMALAEHMTQQRGKFTSYQLEQVRHLKRPNSIRIFEMLMQWRDTGVLRMPLSELREMLSVGYSAWADLARYVINPAIEDINAGTSYIATARPIKVGRKVTTIEIKFRENPQKKIVECGLFDSADPDRPFAPNELATAATATATA